MFTVLPATEQYFWLGATENPDNVAGIWLNYFEMRAVEKTK